MTTINAVSCSESDVQTAINSAVNGDTVIVPTGTCTWTNAINMNQKAITLQGAGIDKTIINGSVNTNNGSIVITGHATLHTIIKDFTINSATSQTWYPVITTNGVYSNTGVIRITGCKFNTTQTIIVMYGNQSILLDNNNFILTGGNPAEIMFIHGDGSPSWSRPNNFGSGTGQVIMENNVFDASLNTAGGWAYAFTALDGARFTLRYNTLINCYISANPNTWGHPYAARQSEIYNNTFSTSRLIDLKGGTSVIYNNIGGTITLHAPTLFYPSDTNAQCCCISNLTNAACTQRPGMGYNYQLDPIYIWGNSNDTPEIIDYDGNECDSGCGGHQITSNAIRLNTEYVIGTQKPGYVSLVYPHPLNTTCPSIQILFGVT